MQFMKVKKTITEDGSQYAHVSSGAQDAANQHDKHELAMYLTWITK